MRMRLILAAAVLFSTPAFAKAQVAGTTRAPLGALCVSDVNRICSPVSQAAPLVTIGKREFFQLVTANVPSAPVTVAGGDYILDQICSSYGRGSLTLKRPGPDGVTWLTTVSKITPDTTTGSGVTLGNGAQVKVDLTVDTAGCFATVSRVPG